MVASTDQYLSLFGLDWIGLDWIELNFCFSLIRGQTGYEVMDVFLLLVSFINVKNFNVPFLFRSRLMYLFFFPLKNLIVQIEHIYTNQWLKNKEELVA